VAKVLYIAAYDSMLFICFRLTKDTSRALMEELVPLMSEISRKTAITHKLQVQFILNFNENHLCNDIKFLVIL